MSGVEYGSAPDEHIFEKINKKFEKSEVHFVVMNFWGRYNKPIKSHKEMLYYEKHVKRKRTKKNL